MVPLRKYRRLSILRQEPVLITHKNRETSKHGWSSLPPEVLVMIFRHLVSVGDKENAMKVCRTWNTAMNDKSVWRKSCVCIKRLEKVPQSYWTILQTRGIKRLCVRGNILSILSKVQEYILDLTHLQVVLNEKSESVDAAGGKLIANVARFSSLTQFVLTGTGTQRVKNMDGILNVLDNLTELGLVNLASMELSSPPISHSSRLQILSLKHLGTVHCSQTTALINMLPNLKHLEIKACVYTAEFISSKLHKEGDMVSSLSLANTTFDGSVQEFPFRFQYLESLDLMSCQQSEEQLGNILEQLHHLKQLNLSGNECTDYVLLKLKSPLETIELKMCVKVTSKGVKHLAEFSDGSLRSLGLGHCTGVDVTVATNMHKLFHSLTYLDLSGWTGLSPATLKPLQKLSHLQTLVLQAIPTSQLSTRMTNMFSMQCQNKSCRIIR